MAEASAMPTNFAKIPAAKTSPRLTRNESTNFAIINKIRDIFTRDAVPSLASLLKLTLRTARNRLEDHREFSLDEIETLLHSEHGFAILSALMTRAKKKPDWWHVCEPLMDLADAERLVETIRRRTDKAIRKREETIDALETELRRAQTMAIHQPAPSRDRVASLRAYAGKENRVVAARKGGAR